MPQIRGIVARALRRVSEAPRMHFANGSNLLLMSGGGLLAVEERERASVMPPTLGRRFFLLNDWAARPWNGLADELFYRSYCFLIAG